MLVFDQGDVDVDVHVLRADGDPAGAGCLERDDREVSASLPAGDYDVVFDTYDGDDRAGPYQTVIYVADS